MYNTKALRRKPMFPCRDYVKSVNSDLLFIGFLRRLTTHLHFSGCTLERFVGKFAVNVDS